MYRTLDEMRAALAERGYKQIPERAGIQPGQRVRHYAHQYPEAYRDGTATVLAVMLRDPSPWTQTYQQPDVEVIVQSDRPYDAEHPIRTWASYHVQRIEGHS